MKTISFAVCLLCFLLFWNCQKSYVTAPEDSLQTSKFFKDPGSNMEESPPKIIINKDVIIINQMINDLMLGNSEIIGEVMYTLEIGDNTQQPEGLYYVWFSTVCNAELCDKCGIVHLPWTITGENEDEFFVSEDGIYILQKAYAIENRDEVVLIVQYLVTIEGAGIPNMWLEVVD
jgi:hypothetical protein